MTTQRQLKVGETLKRVISAALTTVKIHEHFLPGVFFIVTEVKVSPDLKNATVFVTPILNNNPEVTSEIKEKTVDFLNDFIHEINKYVVSNIEFKSTPKLKFKYDDTADQAQKIDNLIATQEKK